MFPIVFNGTFEPQQHRSYTMHHLGLDHFHQQAEFIASLIRSNDPFGPLGDGIKQTPVVSGLDNFLTVSVGGSCPVWQVSVWVFDIRLDQWCQSGIPWELIRAVVLACAAFLAFRIAFQ